MQKARKAAGEAKGAHALPERQREHIRKKLYDSTN
jgi:hypothetical protein